MKKIYEQYKEVKRNHEESLILIEHDGSYFTFDDDSMKLKDSIGIETSICNGILNSSFQKHHLDLYIRLLVRHGNRVGICDEL